MFFGGKSCNSSIAEALTSSNFPKVRFYSHSMMKKKPKTTTLSRDQAVIKSPDSKDRSLSETFFFYCGLSHWVKSRMYMSYHEDLVFMSL